MPQLELLAPKLTALREEAQRTWTKERWEATQRLIDELERAVVPQVLAVGDRAPDFTLRAAGSGEGVRLTDAIQEGPVVLSFYRGQW